MKSERGVRAWPWAAEHAFPLLPLHERGHDQQPGPRPRSHLPSRGCAAKETTEAAERCPGRSGHGGVPQGATERPNRVQVLLKTLSTDRRAGKPSNKAVGLDRAARACLDAPMYNMALPLFRPSASTTAARESCPQPMNLKAKGRPEDPVRSFKNSQRLVHSGQAQPPVLRDRHARSDV